MCEVVRTTVVVCLIQPRSWRLMTSRGGRRVNRWEPCANSLLSSCALCVFRNCQKTSSVSTQHYSPASERAQEACGQKLDTSRQVCVKTRHNTHTDISLRLDWGDNPFYVAYSQQYTNMQFSNILIDYLRNPTRKSKQKKSTIEKDVQSTIGR